MASASFTFSGSDPGGSGVASFECKLDAGAFAPCPSPKELSDLGDGAHSFEVRAVDQAGNADASPASFTWSVDTTAPQTQIDSHPPAVAPSASASFTFSGLDPGGSGVASFECRRDSEEWAACASPRTYAALAEGTHTFEVRAVDNGGNTDATPASFTWTIDTIAPQTQIDTHPSALVNVATATFTFFGADAGGSGVASFECKLDAGSFAPCSSPKELSGLGDGSHTFEVRAVDNADNADASPAIFTWTVDTTAPSTQIDTHPTVLTNSAVGNFTFSGADTGGSGVASFECKLDAGSFAPCSSPKELSGLGDGSHSFEVRAVDQAGNKDGSPASFTWSVDTAAPDTQIDTHPLAFAPSNSASFGFSGSDPDGSGVASFECKLDAGAFAPCSSPRELSGLADGSHTFEVRAIDNADNADATPASFTWTVDTTAPTTQIDTHPAAVAASSSASFGFSGADGSGSGIFSFECRRDFEEWAACGSPRSYAALADGSHSFEVRAIDQAGNTDATPASFAWTVDTIAPSTQIDSHPTALTNSAAATFTFSGADSGGSGVASFECKLDAGAFAPCSSPRELSGLSDGSHSFEVRAVDQAGNKDGSPASFTWSVDTAAPDTQIDTHPLAFAPSNSASFGFSGSDPGGSASPPSSAAATPKNGRPAARRATTPRSPRAPTASKSGRSTTPTTPMRRRPPSPGRSTPPRPPPRSTPTRPRSPTAPPPTSPSPAPTPAAPASPPSNASSTPAPSRSAARRGN